MHAFSEALELAEHSDDDTIRGNLLVNRGVLHGWVGEIDAAEEDTRRALDLYDQRG